MIEQNQNQTQKNINNQVEQALLGLLMTDPNNYWDIANVLNFSVEWFDNHAHKVLYTIISDLYLAQKSVSIVTVADMFSQKMSEDDSPILPYLYEALEMSAGNKVEELADILKKNLLHKNINLIAQRLMSISSSQQDLSESEIMALLYNETARVEKLTDGQSKEYIGMDELIAEEAIAFGDDDNYGKSTFGISTGYKILDDCIKGFHRGSLVVIAGRPGMGKTSFALNMAEHVAYKELKNVIFFSMEMGGGELAKRTFVSQTKFSMAQLTDPRFKEDPQTAGENMMKVADVLDHICDVGHRLQIVPNIAVNGHDISRFVKKIAMTEKMEVDLIVIDYLQLMNDLPQTSSLNNAQVIGKTTRYLKQLAGQLKCTIVLLSQLNRKVEDRTDRRPVLSDLRDSGSIEQDADVVLLLNRVNNEDNDNSQEGIKAEVIVAKNRNGVAQIGLPFIFKGELTRYDEGYQ